MFTNWTGGTSAITVLNLNFGSSSTTTVTQNTISNISGAGAITGMVARQLDRTANFLRTRSAAREHRGVGSPRDHVGLDDLESLEE